MSRFLRVGVISDRIGDIIEASSMLMNKIDPDDEESLEIAKDILAMATDLKQFLARWSSEPIIYTGRGTTDEVIGMLDALLSRQADGAPAGLRQH